MVEDPDQGLHEVLGLDRAAGNVDDRQPALGGEAPAQVVGEAHAAGRVAYHGMDAAEGGAGAATTAQALGASWSIHQFSVCGSPVSGSFPKDVQ